MINRFRIVPFLIGVAVGYVILTYYTADKPIVYEYPHPDTVDNSVYKDRKGECYSYTATEVDCDANEATIKPYPLA